MRRNLVALFVVFLLLICLPGCLSTRPIILHPIEKSDIFPIDQGSIIKQNQRNTEPTVVEKDGWFISDLYLEQVMKARVE